jgi:hypothetical protein
MLKRLWILLLACFAPVVGGGPNSPVTVILSFDQPHSDISLSEMEREASAVLKGTGLTFDWKLQDSLSPEAEFVSLLVFKMKGRCAMDPRRLPRSSRRSSRTYAQGIRRT